MAASSSPALRHLSATNRSHPSLFIDAPHNPAMVILVAFWFLLLLVRHHWFSSPLVTPTCLRHFKGDALHIVAAVMFLMARVIYLQVSKKSRCYQRVNTKEFQHQSHGLKINLLPPPLGEGLSYEALSKDLRPSLDWCPEKGWSVPIPVFLFQLFKLVSSIANCHPCPLCCPPSLLLFAVTAAVRLHCRCSLLLSAATTATTFSPVKSRVRCASMNVTHPWWSPLHSPPDVLSRAASF
ncbi:hypothetical protein LR48_Vigan06g145500 [Vigna angularis]|uniref:Uncharacterized protein n=1 Tax=Phaseolus angularis TaxID=3914 RepID=A0A0L9UUE0_PHAAN|nr:hypothetical protein LR48_Vigan06g145500 [Vigna angularis]